MAKLADMRSADLRNVLVLQAPPDGQGTRGERTGDWSDVATLRAKVESLSGDERQEANQISGVVTHRVTIRWRSGLDVTQRLKMSGESGARYLNIGFVNNLEERSRWVELLCREDV